MVQHLMPVSTEAPRCSEFARSIGLLPRGTGLFLSRVVLVSVPLPWPKPALQHELLKPAAKLIASSAVPSRLFACEPQLDRASLITVEIYERAGAEARRYSFDLDTADELEPLIAKVADADSGSLDTLGSSTAVPPTFLVCTQGSHDSCCGTSGVALAEEIVETRPDYVVRRVSHTGGHRFSPTFMSFPEGRMWAFADLDLVDRIAADATTTNDHELRARGWWGAKVGPAQVAENAVRAELAGQPFAAPTIVAVEPVEGQQGHKFEVSVHDTSWHVDVQVGRQVPTIACESPGGLPAKPAREFSYQLERR